MDDSWHTQEDPPQGSLHKKTPEKPKLALREDPQREEKKNKFGRRGKKARHFWPSPFGPHPSRFHPSEPPRFLNLGSHLLNPPPKGPPPFRPPPFGPTLLVGGSPALSGSLRLVLGELGGNFPRTQHCGCSKRSKRRWVFSLNSKIVLSTCRCMTTSIGEEPDTKNLYFEFFRSCGVHKKISKRTLATLRTSNGRKVVWNAHIHAKRFVVESRCRDDDD